MTKTTISNIQPQDTVRVGYSRGGFFAGGLNRFEGFTVGDAEFGTLKEVKAYLGERTMRNLECKANSLGTSVRAKFYDYEAEFLWEAYIWGGAFRLGSSADRLQFKEV